MEVILYIFGHDDAGRVADNVTTSVVSVQSKSNPVEIEPVTLNGKVIKRFKANIRRGSTVCGLVDILCEQFGYVSCIEWERCFYASIPSDDDEGWEAKLAEAMAVHAGFVPGKYFRSLTYI